MMKKNVYKAPVKEVIAINPRFDENTNKLTYDKIISKIGKIELFYNMFNRLVTVGTKDVPILDSEVDDLIELEFTLNKRDFVTVQYVDTNELEFSKKIDIPKIKIKKR